MSAPLTTRPSRDLVDAALRCQGRRDHYVTGKLAQGERVVAVDPLGVLTAETLALYAAGADEVADERARQDVKWGEQNHPDGTGGVAARGLADALRRVCDAEHDAGAGTWSSILAEEVGEAFAESDPAALRAELVQVAAVAVQWVAAIDRRTSTAPAPAPAVGDLGEACPAWFHVLADVVRDEGAPEALRTAADDATDYVLAQRRTIAALRTAAERDRAIADAVRRDADETRRAASTALLPPYARGRLDALNSILGSV